jgi:hypothetical protein
MIEHWGSRSIIASKGGFRPPVPGEVSCLKADYRGRTSMNRNEFQEHLVKKAWADPEFKARLLQDPRGVMSEELAKIQEGVSIPETVEVTVLEEQPGHIYMVLPINPAEITGKVLSEEDLDRVAGGQAAVQQVETQIQVALQLDVQTLNVITTASTVAVTVSDT